MHNFWIMQEELLKTSFESKDVGCGQCLYLAFIHMHIYSRVSVVTLEGHLNVILRNPN